MYRIKSPFDGNMTVWEFVSQDRKKVIVEIFTIKGIPTASYECFVLKALDCAATYVDKVTGKKYSGESLMHIGLKRKRKQDYCAEIMILEMC